MALTRLGLNQAVNLSSNTTGTLGVANGGTGLTSGTTDQFLKFTGSTTVASSAVDGNKITEYDNWRVTANFQGDAVPISSNWSRATGAFEKIGTGLSESSGIFSFPSTGKYLVMTGWRGFSTSPDSRYNELEISVTENNSSYTTRASTSQFIKIVSANTYAECSTQCLIDVTDTSNVKFRVQLSVENNNIYSEGDVSMNRLYMTCMRVGDT